MSIDRKGIIVIFSLIMFFMIYVFFAENFEIAGFSKVSYILLMPIPFITMMISILYNIYLSLFVALYIIFFALMVVGIDAQSVFLSFSSAIIGTFINLHVDKRSDFFKGGLILGVIDQSNLSRQYGNVSLQQWNDSAYDELGQQLGIDQSMNTCWKK